MSHLKQATKQRPYFLCNQLNTSKFTVPLVVSSFQFSVLFLFRLGFIKGNQTISYLCTALTLNEGEQAERKIDMGSIGDTEEIIVKIIFHDYTHV